MTTDATKCLVCKRRTLRDGETMACQRCVESLDERLADLATLYALLPAVMEPGSVQLNDMPHGKQVDAPAPVRLEITDLMDGRLMLARGKYPTDKRRGVLGVLESWTRIVVEERRLSTPTERATVVVEVATLRRNLSWIGEQAWVDEFADEIRDVQRQLERVCGEPKPKPIGKCPAGVGEDATCGAPLFAPVYGDVVTCGRCGANWTRDRWLLLGSVLEGEAS